PNPNRAFVGEGAIGGVRARRTALSSFLSQPAGSIVARGAGGSRGHGGTARRRRVPPVDRARALVGGRRVAGSRTLAPTPPSRRLPLARCSVHREERAPRCLPRRAGGGGLAPGRCLPVGAGRRRACRRR